VDNTRFSSQLACGQSSAFLPFSRSLSQFARKASHLHRGNLYPARPWGVYKRRQTYNKPLAQGRLGLGSSLAQAGCIKRFAVCLPSGVGEDTVQTSCPALRASVSAVPLPYGIESPFGRSIRAQQPARHIVSNRRPELAESEPLAEQLSHSREHATACWLRPNAVIAVSTWAEFANRSTASPSANLCPRACTQRRFLMCRNHVGLLTNIRVGQEGALAFPGTTTTCADMASWGWKSESPNPSGVEARSGSGVVLGRFLTWQKPDRYGSKQGGDR
jgi:hypothetical protein